MTGTVTLTTPQACSALYALADEERRTRATAERYGWTAAHHRITEGDAAAQVSILRQLGTPGRQICGFRRIQLGFGPLTPAGAA